MSELLTIIIPFYNEKGWIGQTVKTIADQENQNFKLILVDNASTDDGASEAMDAAKVLGARLIFTYCEVAGKTNAMQHGLNMVETPYVAICDADTIYPPAYVGNIIALFSQNPSAVAVMAIDVYGDDRRLHQKRKDFVLRKSRRFSAKCHAGGYAQSYRTDVVKKAGGFDGGIWPYTLEDHEIVHRLHQYGHSVYHSDHYCFPSERRTCRAAVHWTGLERLLYRYMPQRGMNWFFYQFLGRQLDKRGSRAQALREKNWDDQRQAI